MLALLFTILFIHRLNYRNFEENKVYPPTPPQKNVFLSLIRIDFAARLPCGAARVFLALSHQRVRPFTRPLFWWFSKEIARGAVRAIW